MDSIAEYLYSRMLVCHLARTKEYPGEKDMRKAAEVARQASKVYRESAPKPESPTEPKAPDSPGLALRVRA